METTNLTLQDLAVWATILVSAGTAFGLVLNAIVQALKAKWEKRQLRLNETVEAKKVRVSEREVENHEVQILFEGFRLLNEENRRAAVEAKDEVRVAHQRIDEIVERLDRERQVREEIIDHVQVLEAGYPNPPGPPTRPNWKIT